MAALHCECARSGPTRYLTSIDQVDPLPNESAELLSAVTDRYGFRATQYYLGLINPDLPNDPIARLILPSLEELDFSGDLDPSNEAAMTLVPGLQHKYPETVLLLCSNVCAGLCRYCFRKRLFMDATHEAAPDLDPALDYITGHPEITNVLLTGGDPLMLDTGRLAYLLERLRAIPHVQIIRIGTKVPAFNPFRILDDPGLKSVLRAASRPDRRLYVMTHFDHPRELTEPAVQSIDCLLRAGVICANQCPLARGINDSSLVLAELFQRLAFCGCPPYYLFQMRPAAGNRPYQVPIVRGWQVFREALRRGSGLARRARYVMSHASGKLEILGLDDRFIYMRYHRAHLDLDRGRFLIFERNDEACWLDDLTPTIPGRW